MDEEEMKEEEIEKETEKETESEATPTPEEKPEKEPKKVTKAIALTIAAFALGGVLFFQLNQASSPVSGLFDKSYTEQKWSEEAFRAYTQVESTLMDSSVLDVNHALKEWYDANLETAGVHTMADDAYTYILATGGMENKDTIIQLFDIVKGKGELVIGYSFLRPEELGIEPTTEIPNLILRIDKTEGKVVGRFIQEAQTEEVESHDDDITVHDGEGERQVDASYFSEGQEQTQAALEEQAENAGIQPE